MKIEIGQKRIAKILERFQIHPLFGLRLITYPLTALSTFLNLWVISSEYGNALFNLFLLAWMLTGTVQVLEYALGIEIMNIVAIQGFQKAILRRVYKNISILGLILSLVYFVVSLPVNRDRIDKYLQRFPSEASYQTQVLISIFFISLFFSGSYQLLSRILLGLRMNASTQLAGLFGYILSSVSLCFYTLIADQPKFWISFAMGMSPIAISLIPAAFLVSRLKPGPDVPSGDISKKFTGAQYGITYLVVSLLSTFNVYFPRVMTNLSGIELTRYFITFTIIGIFMNISSSLSQLLWVENLKNFPERVIILKRYRRALTGSFYSLPFFVLTSLFLYTVYSKLEASRQMWGLVFLAFLFFALQNIHLMTSSLILSKKDLMNASGLLIAHNLFLIFLSRSEQIIDSASSYLLILIISSVLINYLPSLFLIKKRIRQNEA
jgi:hypothetical protein